MSKCKQERWMPKPNHLKSNTRCNDICRNRIHSRVRIVNIPSINVTYFQNFQIVNPSNLSIEQSNCYSNVESIIQPPIKNSLFSRKTVDRRKSHQSNNTNSPPKCCTRCTLRKAFQIPNVLRTTKCYRRSIGSCKFLHNQAPNSKIDQNINKHICPKSSGCFKSRSTQRHQKQSHMSNTTVSKQTFLICLCLRSLPSKKHRKNPKNRQSISKSPPPLVLPMMCPKT